MASGVINCHHDNFPATAIKMTGKVCSWIKAGERESPVAFPVVFPAQVESQAPPNQVEISMEQGQVEELLTFVDSQNPEVRA